MPRKQRYLRLSLEGPVVEQRPEASWLSGRRRIWFHELIRVLRQAAQRPALRCLWVVVKDNHLSWSQIEEFHLELRRLHESGKESFIFLEAARNRDYYLASGFQRILLSPSSGLELTGLRSELLFFADLLNWAGVNPQIVQVGRFKSAAEILTRAGFSEASREMLDSILEDMQGRLLSSIAQGRHLPRDQVQSLVDNGPYTSRRALDAGLVDGICYEDELEEQLAARFKPLAPGKLLRKDGVIKRLLTFRRPQIAYIVVEGLIKSGQSSRGPGQTAAGSDSIRGFLRRARKSRRVAGVVLRINSPGGSALASDLMWREVVLTDREKPVIVSMAGEAASGGYYLAAGGRYIFAMPGSLTGSIGAIGGKISLRRLLRSLLIHPDSIEKGAHAGYSSVTRDFTPHEASMVKALAEDVYDRFLERVQQGRNMARQEVREVAQGRVWTGSQAQRNGLVDALGGAADAIEKAKDEAGIPRRRSVRLAHYREKRRLRDLLSFPLVGSLAEARIWTLNPFRWRIY